MSAKNKVSRRKFIVRGGLGAVGLLAVGTYVFRNPIRRSVLEVAETLVPPYSGSGMSANLWFEITEDNTVKLYSPKVEMGQGTFTGLAQMVADEMDLTMEQVEVVGAATDTGVVDALSTGGSLSVAQLWDPLRELAATMREMLKTEAANKLGTTPDQLTTEKGIASNGSQSLTYAEIAKGVQEWTIPDAPDLRPRSAHKFVGQPVKRVDLAPKVFGDPIFGQDAVLPDMLHACIVRPEHIGATLASFDASEASSMPGVVQVVDKKDWIGIVAESYPQALAAKAKLRVEWDIPKVWTEAEIREMLTVGQGNKMVTQKAGSALDPEDPEVFSLEFSSPIGAHAQMEPNGAVAHVEGDKATIIISTQVIGITQNQVADALGIPKENVNVIPTYLGGGFGRRLNTNHAVRAAQLSQAVGKPVKYFFTRKEEFQNDTFRPPTHHIVRGKLNDAGQLSGLEHHYASGDVAINSVIMPAALHTILGTDVGAMRGGNIQYDLIPNHRAVQWHTTLPFATSWWRSLGLLANTFAIESFVDEMALRAEQDPVAFRLSQISDEGEGKRLKAVIEKAGEHYREGARDGRAMGFAASIDTGTPCAQVVDLSVKDGNLTIHKVVCVMDCGIAVNPDQVKAQCEGAINMGISAAMHEKMTIDEGRLFPTIYGAYEMALMKHSPRDIEVILLEGVDRPLPVGEPPLGPIGAALGNALRRITGQRFTDLPIKLT
ncbi:xanthine dehydrogenase family protein molybdopterin-binding subunit [Lewinella sp. W8]|uniref:xanthine dehydrogenase family protein molybdopterin-binding subunit n=1 Tax=Lewinella sp. W8 TaxID=2528208 RepID=UPI00106896CF|nr:molybdopterin cofactor-binding domain-containing protein [Lewinella sp. W8]MTB50001.1 molybdopterin-dependent oxidoreductase [Lewinella sp. W8]